MEIKNFIIHVKDMMEAQKAYFRTRSKVDLQTAKDLEKAVDKDLVEIANLFR